MDALDAAALPLAIGLGLTAAVLALWGITGGKTKLLAAAGACVLLAAAVVGLERVTVSEPERIEAAVAELAAVVVAGDADAAVAFFTPEAVLARGAVRAGMALVDVQDDVRLTDFATTVAGDGATCHFRANATFTLVGRGFSQRTPTRWETRWERRGDEWLIAGVTRLNPISGEQMGVLDPK